MEVKMNYKGKGGRGFTLIEIMIALFIMGLVTSALYNLYVQNTRTWTCQGLISDMQQAARVSMDIISRDLSMAGYDIKESAGGNTYKAIDQADTTTITFQYNNEVVGGNRRYTYWLDGTTLKRRTAQWNDASGYPSIGSGGSVDSLAEDVVANFTLSYYDGSGNLLATPVTDTEDIRLVKVSLEVQTADECPTDNESRSASLTTQIRPRNMGIGAAAIDSSAPACPTGLALTDPNVCGDLNLAWNANSEVDLSGYVIYYGQSTGVYTNRTDAGDSTLRTLTGLTAGVTYYVRVTAYDENGNESSLGNCTEQSLVIVADAPQQPTSLDATASITGSPQVFLNWSSNVSVDPDETDVTKYEIWRQNHTSGSWAKRADVAGATSNSYTDAVNESDKCQTFEYKIRAVTSCSGTPDLYSDYSDTVYGDGSGTTIDPDVPTAGVTNTRPSDDTPPSKPFYGESGDPQPVLSSAGYRRTFINWNNPSDLDLDSISIRYNAGATPSYPASKDDGTGVENGSGGLFDASPGATGQAYTHKGISGCDTDPACLTDGATYAYSLFAIDTCGNASDASGTAQTTIGQCGEEDAGASSGAPPTPLNFGVSACNTYDFTWGRIDDTYPTGVYDLAGFYLYRSTDGGSTWSKANADIILNPTSGQVSRSELGIQPDRNSAYEGKIYKYKVYSIDCIRETQYAQDPTAGTLVPAFVGGIASDVLTVTPGRVTFANNSGVTTGDLVAPTGSPDHSAIVKDFYHNSVKLSIENTSYGPVEWDSADISWTNDSAYLKAIYRTDTSPEQLVWSVTTPLLSGSTVTISDGLRVDGSLGGEVNETVPLRFIFTDSAGDVGVNQDIRQSSITFSNIKYTKIFYRDGVEMTVPPSCTDETNTETVDIPFNPRAEGTIQDKPSLPTFSWAVPGISVTNNPGQIEVGAGSVVNIYTNAFLDAGRTLTSIRLHYAVTDRTTATAPAGPASYTPVEMFQKEGNLYALYTGSGTDNRIPASNDQRIWYYIVAIDDRGNFDREPEVTSGHYTYDQKASDPCADTPEAPDRLEGSPSGYTSVFLNWSAPSLNTDGSNIVDTLKYDIYRSDAGLGGTFNTVATDISVLSYTDSSFGNLTSNDYVWKVKAKDNCPSSAIPPGPRGSDYSSPWMECEGGGGISVTAGKSNILANDTDGFSLMATVCSLAQNTTTDTITVHMDAAAGPDEDTVTMVETGISTGIFQIDDSLADHGSVITASDSGYCDPGATCLYVDPDGDTITFDWLNDGTTTHSDTYATVSVIADVCGKTPNPPLNLAITAEANAQVDLAWTEPTLTDYNNVGLSVYRVYHNVNSSGWVAIGDVAKGTNIVSVAYSGSTATLNGSANGNNVKNNVIQYRLKSINSCPKESADSNIVTETKI